MTFLPDFPFRLSNVGIVAECVAWFNDKCIDAICYKGFCEVVSPQNVFL
jgi:hypothetical protein